MLARQYVRENPDEVREAIELKGVEGVDLDAVLELDEEWRELKARGEPVAGPGGAGCSQMSGQGPLGAGGWLAALGLGGLFVRRWTDR